MNGCLNRTCTCKHAAAYSCRGVAGRRVDVVRLVLRPAAAVGVQRTEAAIQLVEALDMRVEALILRGRKDSESA